MQDAMKNVTDKMAALWRFHPAMWPSLQEASDSFLSCDMQVFHRDLLMQQVGMHHAFLFKPHQCSHSCSTVSWHTPPMKNRIATEAFLIKAAGVHVAAIQAGRRIA
jgi:hypothetical protein